VFSSRATSQSQDQQALPSAPSTSVDTGITATRRLLQLGKNDEAIAQLQQMESTNPGMKGLAHELGIAYYKSGDYLKAIDALRKASLALNPGHAATYYKLADAYSRIQKFDEAERLLQRSIWLDATSTGPYILLGKVLGKKGEAELAVRALQHALTMDPNNSMAHHLLGQAYQDMGRTSEAERERKLAQELQDVPRE
jgi:Flp pilus assembly protein TadD